VIIKEDTTAGAVYMKLRDGEVADTVEVADADAYVDLDAEGNVLGIEFLSLDEYHGFTQAAGGLRVPDHVEDPADVRLSLA
jgi:uncharacterized protein YuzE